MQKIINLLYKIYDFVKQYFLYKIFISKIDRRILAENVALKKKYIGKKCFILGNGPSLSDEKLELLNGEILFVVNQISRNNQYEKIKPSFYFCMDDNFFNIDKSKVEDIEMLRSMQKVIKDNEDIICVYPLKYKEYVEDNELNTARTFYINPGLYLYEEYKEKPDMTRYVPSFGTVVQYAIFAAIYMGFEEINVLGCDSTGIMSTLNAALGVENKTYSYEVTHNEKKRMEMMVKKSQVVNYAYSYYMTLKGFVLLDDYCKQRKINLVNLSKRTVLDMLERDSLEKVIQKRENVK